MPEFADGRRSRSPATMVCCSESRRRIATRRAAAAPGAARAIPLRTDELSRIGDVTRTGRAELIRPTDEWLRMLAEDDDHLGLLREIAWVRRSRS